MKSDDFVADDVIPWFDIAWYCGCVVVVVLFDQPVSAPFLGQYGA